MKLKTLKIKNIASIEDAVIDFAGEPLASQDLFLICGPTGSGKTTILDAICLALFDNTPRIKSSAGNLINAFAAEGNAATNRVNSVMHLVRKNAVEASVSLSFEGSDGREYTARWEVTRKGQYKKRKKKVVANGEEKEITETYEVSTFAKESLEEQLRHEFKKEWTLTDDDGVDTIKGVAERIQEVIRMTFDQFCKTTLLAQGEFTKFLSSSADEKAQILEKLVGTEHYAEVGRVINQTANAKRNEMEQLRREVDLIKSLSDTEKENKKLLLADCETQMRATAEKKAAVERKLQWIIDSARAGAEQRRAAEALRLATEETQTEQAQAEQARVALWDHTIVLHEAMLQKRKAVAAAASYQTKTTALEGEYNRLAATKFTCDDEQRQTSFLTAIERERSAAEEKKKAVEKDIDALEQKAEQLKALMKEKGADTIDGERDNLNRQLALVNDAEHAEQQLTELTAQHRASVEAAQQAAEAIAAAQAAEERKLSELQAANTRLEESLALYEKTKAAVSDQARLLRMKLKKGDACPVCGQTIEESLSDEVFLSAFRPIEEKHQEDARRVQVLTKEHAATHANHAAAITLAAKARGEEQQALLRRKKQEEALKAKMESIERIGNSADIQSLDELKQRISERLEALNKKQEEIAAVRTEFFKTTSDATTLRKTRLAAIEETIRRWDSLLREAGLLAAQAAVVEEQLAAAEQSISLFLEANPAIHLATVEALLAVPAEEIDRARRHTALLAEALANAKAVLAAAERRKEELPPSPLAEGETEEALKQESALLDQLQQQAAQQVGRLNAELDADRSSQQEKEKKNAELLKLSEEYAEWETLNRFLGGNADGKNFRNIAQSFILGDLLGKANQYLENITGRYTLFCNPGTLTILMRDAFQGGTTRPTNTLSGGESFIISLSLALGLSSMQSSGFEVDTLFIDEGFGTLSPEFLDPVIGALKSLYSTYGRRVGIISHVDTLRARIPTTIELSKHASSCSRVEVAG